MSKDKKLIRTNVMFDKEVLQSIDDFAKTIHRVKQIDPKPQWAFLTCRGMPKLDCLPVP